MNKVDIDIEENEKNRRKFAAIALTVDREDFQKILLKIRYQFNIDTSRNCPHSKEGKSYFESFLASKTDTTDLLKLWFSLRFGGLYDILSQDIWYDIPDSKQHVQQKESGLYNRLISYAFGKRKREMKITDEFGKTLTNLRRQLHTSERMERVLAHAIICNKVTVDDLSGVQVSQEFEKNKNGVPTLFIHFNMSIPLEATLDDVVNAYRKEILPAQNSGWGVDRTIPSSTKDEIFRDRKRYWQNKSGTGYKLIAAGEEGLDKYKKAMSDSKRLRKVPLNQDLRKQKEEAERIISHVDIATPAVKKSVNRYKQLLKRYNKNPDSE